MADFLNQHYMSLYALVIIVAALLSAGLMGSGKP